MIVRVSFSSLGDSRWYEYFVRFLLGGTATVMTGLVGQWWGPAVGGLFLAFPAMLCASATLVQTHERRRKKEAGLTGDRRGADAAALDAAGAALGSVGLMAFAAVVLRTNAPAPWSSLALASLAWAVAAACCWWIYKRSSKARS
ncbi:DUF3147 family protein [Tardiphaga sp. 1201_B9_N1_1]|uniref:DUF3147 family protein n=1 Tax=unclassified Tardiphaga TaxID=2631404 RepID=UPI003F28F4DB